jgi:hypothetical protein
MKKKSTPTSRFAEAVHKKFSTHVSGEPEDQIRAPFEQLLREIGAELGIQDIVPIGETSLPNSLGRPDYSVTRGKLSSGYVELKAPGKGANTSLLTGHDKQQWARFSNLPNILYSDGREFSLYRSGKQIHSVALPQDPRAFGAQAADDESHRKLAVLFRDFFEWEPIVPGSAKQLAEYLAPLCRNLRDDVLDSLKSQVPAVKSAANDWRRYLFPGADDARFADAYAQTVTFSLLLARSDGSDTPFIDDAVAALTHANSLLARALRVLTDPLVKEHLGSTLDVLMRVINKVPAGTMSGGRRDPWLNFYEDFLAEYDPKLRRDAGAYYTPVEVVKAQVCIVDELLRKKFRKKFGFATGGVNVLDPAVGTGTYLLGIIEHALETVRQTEGPGAVPARADVLGGSLYGLELMVGPYAVAALRLTRMLQQYGGHLPGDGAQIMLNNTLESPHEKIPELPLFYQPIGLEHMRAKRVKEAVPVLVCIGNPPYDRHEAATRENQAMTGGWVRWGESKDGSDAILKDFIAPVSDAGKGGDLKNLYNLYVYFWRWALWKTFEHEFAHGPGIVSFITASSFMDGAAFLGMRQHMRRLCDEIWIIDLGGEGRGTRQDDNVFAIQTPVAITIAARYGTAAQSDKPATVHYSRIEGTRAAKLHQLETLQSLADLKFEDAPTAWDAPFRPAGKGDYFDWPLLTDLMPWQQSGVQLKRTWPIGVTVEILQERWRKLLAASDQVSAFRETPYRTISKAVDALHGSYPLEPLKKLPTSAQPEAIARYGYRSFDRQFVIADGRIGDRLRPVLWHIQSEQQIYFASLFTHPLSAGPALTVSAEMPDLHFFRGSYGAKDIVPLYRDPKATRPNLHPQLLEKLTAVYQNPVSPEDFAAYLYGLLAQPAFTERFAKELGTREIRLPLTTDAALFNRVASVGRELLFLHTYGERFQNGLSWPRTTAKCLRAVPGNKLPDRFRYDEATRIIHVDNGQFGPVDKTVWEYEISGFKVVQSWLGYRLAHRKGKKSSPLDNITPSGWTSDFTSEFLQLLNLLARTVELHSGQAELLKAVTAGPLLKAGDFPLVPEEWRHAPKITVAGVGQEALDWSD